MSERGLRPEALPFTPSASLCAPVPNATPPQLGRPLPPPLGMPPGSLKVTVGVRPAPPPPPGPMLLPNGVVPHPVFMPLAPQGMQQMAPPKRRVHNGHGLRAAQRMRGVRTSDVAITTAVLTSLAESAHGGYNPLGSGGDGATGCIRPAFRQTVPCADTEADRESADVSVVRDADPGLALRVDAATFFTECDDDVHVSNAVRALNKEANTAFSLQSLQGVSVTMPPVQAQPWIDIYVLNQLQTVPAPFRPDEGTAPIDCHRVACHPDRERYPNVQLSLFAYFCTICPPTCHVGKLQRPPDLKLGGTCCDLGPSYIAHLVESLSGIHLEAIDVFGFNYGRCNLWLHDVDDAAKLIATLDRRVWMAPPSHGYAVVVDAEDAREYLQWYLECLREHGPKRVRFPRHLLTCEKWIV